MIAKSTYDESLLKEKNALVVGLSREWEDDDEE